MAKDFVTGMTGSLTTPDFDAYFTGVTVRTGQRVAEVSHYGGNGYEQYIGLLKNASGSFVGFVAQGAANTNPFNGVTSTGGSATFTLATGCAIQMNIIVGDIEVVGSYGGVTVFTASWYHSDDVAPTPTWPES